MKIRWGVLGTASIAKHCTIPGMMKAESCELEAIAGMVYPANELHPAILQAGIYRNRNLWYNIFA